MWATLLYANRLKLGNLRGRSRMIGWNWLVRDIAAADWPKKVNLTFSENLFNDVYFVGTDPLWTMWGILASDWLKIVRGKFLKIYLVLVHYLIFRRGHRMWREYGAAYAKVLQKFVWLFSAIEILEEISLNRGYSTVFERVSVAWSLACPEKSKWKFWHQY